ncbi:unnamed protein product [Cuscuta epithymum]|uniref:Uncharacterized protein n=1 Tax=Cuscuta epithymum TaxID=186058 RepID=A0AAV0DID6_9ASTE|nr:unnamed protein product [Cuscuta epithymum]
MAMLPEETVKVVNPCRREATVDEHSPELNGGRCRRWQVPEGGGSVELMAMGPWRGRTRQMLVIVVFLDFDDGRLAGRRRRYRRTEVAVSSLYSR